MIEDIDYLGREWGKWMRYQPNGWSSKNHITNLKKISFASGNSYAPIAVTSDSLDTLGQKSYHPLARNLWAGELKLGAGNWQISASGTSEDVYGSLRKNPADGRINNIRYYRPKILIKRFMPEDALRFHRALNNENLKENLSECHQVMLWAHFVLVVVSPSKSQELREQGKLTCYEVTHKQKMKLLQTTNDQYPKWLGLSRRAITREIERLDTVLSFKKSPPKSVANRNKGNAGPLWPCRIFASIHKFPIRHSNVKDLLPASFSPQGFLNPRSAFDYLPTDNANVFRRANGEIYSVISNIEYGRLYRQGKANAFLAERRENAADYTYRHFDEWHLEWHPGWIKPIPHYNAPHWLKNRGLTMLDQCAQDWCKDLLDEQKRLWKRGGDNAWYL